MTKRVGETDDEFVSRKREYYQKNRQQILDKNKRWRLDNPERLKASLKAWVRENWETKYKSNRRWIVKNPDKALFYTKKWQAANPEKTKQIYKNWVANNPDKRRASRKQGNHKRKAILRAVSFADCRDKIALLNLERFCRWCCTRLSDINKTIDHIIPLSRGGHHIPDNLAAACSRCNYSRNDKLVEEWLPNQKWLSDLMNRTS